MMMNPFRPTSLVILAVALGCGEPRSVDEAGRAEGAPAGGSALTGSLRADGSSTVFPIMEAIGEEFQKEHRDVRVTVGTSGTGGGFKRFCAGETDISDASRPIKSSEAEACAAAGVEYVEIPIAFDGLSVVVNPANDWASCMNVEELERIWQPAAQGKVTRWSQVRRGWPDEELRLYGPGTDSGTYDYFTEAVVGKEGASRGDFTPSEDDNVLVQGVAGDAGALGYFGYAYYEANQDRLKLVAIDGGKGCVAPSAETIALGTYQPLSRPLFIYVRTSALERPEVRAFVDFAITNANALVREAGYIPLTDELYRLARQRVENRTTGSVFASGGSQVGTKLQDLLQAEAGASRPGAAAGSPADTSAAAAPAGRSS